MDTPGYRGEISAPQCGASRAAVAIAAGLMGIAAYSRNETHVPKSPAWRLNAATCSAPRIDATAAGLGAAQMAAGDPNGRIHSFQTGARNRAAIIRGGIGGGAKPTPTR